MIFKTPIRSPVVVTKEPTDEQIEAWCAVIEQWQQTSAYPVAHGWYAQAIRMAYKRELDVSVTVLRVQCKLPHDIVIASFALIFPDCEDYIPH